MFLLRWIEAILRGIVRDLSVLAKAFPHIFSVKSSMESSEIKRQNFPAAFNASSLETDRKFSHFMNTSTSLKMSLVERKKKKHLLFGFIEKARSVQ